MQDYPPEVCSFLRMGFVFAAGLKLKKIQKPMVMLSFSL